MTRDRQEEPQGGLGTPGLFPPGNGHSRLWALAVALVGALVALVGVGLQRELTTINHRLDRLSDYVLQNLPPPPPP
jgi:hypothetical protein